MTVTMAATIKSFVSVRREYCGPHDRIGNSGEQCQPISMKYSCCTSHNGCTGLGSKNFDKANQTITGTGLPAGHHQQARVEVRKGSDRHEHGAAIPEHTPKARALPWA